MDIAKLMVGAVVIIVCAGAFIHIFATLLSHGPSLWESMGLVALFIGCMAGGAIMTGGASGT